MFKLTPYFWLMIVAPAATIIFGLAWLYTGNDLFAIFCCGVGGFFGGMHLTIETLYFKEHDKSPDSATLKKVVNTLFSKQLP